jgi:hypothetical protein
MFGSKYKELLTATQETTDSKGNKLLTATARNY